MGRTGAYKQRHAPTRPLGGRDGERLHDNGGLSGAPLAPPLLLSLQHSAGNRVVVGLIQRFGALGERTAVT